MSERIGVYPGTFDPVTNGHLDIIRRGLAVVDHLVVGVADNDGKGPLFPLETRLDLLRGELEGTDSSARVSVRGFEGLLIHFVEDLKARVILRGLRAVSDFEYEFQMAAMNARLDDRIETVFLMASERHQFISSRFVKEIARMGGDVSQFVPARVRAALGERFHGGKGRDG